jgi:hypothetical protein
LGTPTRRLLAASLDAAAAMVDVTGRPPRQGDGDEGRGLVLDGPDADPWATLLATGAGVLGARAWWPPSHPGVTSVLVGALASPAMVPGRPETAPSAFGDAGIHLLRTAPDDEPQIWCRCDGGPQGFLSIAAHGHADALSLEVRCDGVDVLADPGTYCYHGEPAWRSYFRSTRAHNTVEIDATSQSVEGGPFLWSTHTDGVVDGVELGGPVQTWTAHHTGYARLDRSLRHTREVTLDSVARRLSVADTLVGSTRRTARLIWHLGPEISVILRDGVADLSWSGARGDQHARLHLPAEVTWSAHRGETEPILGWYSPRFGERVPSTTLVGEGTWTGTLSLQTVLDLSKSRREPAVARGPGVTTDAIPPGET